jgi:hypothetical protein
LIRWHDAGAGDGFILGFPVQAQGVDDFVDLVIPILEARGRHSRDLPGSTLRDHLGLPRKRAVTRRATPCSSRATRPKRTHDAAAPPRRARRLPPTTRSRTLTDMSDTTHLGGALAPLPSPDAQARTRVFASCRRGTGRAWPAPCSRSC